MKLSQDTPVRKKHISWANANNNAKVNFKKVFESKLDNIHYGDECFNVNCKLENVFF